MLKRAAQMIDMKPAIKFGLMIMFAVLSLTMVAPVSAQTNGAQRIESPDFNTTSVEASIKALGENEQLTEEQKTQAKGFLEIAAVSLASAAKNLESGARYRGELENASKAIAALRKDTDKIQTALFESPTISDEPMREEALIQLEQDLIIKEGALRSLRSEIEGYDTGLQNLATRQVAAPKDLNDARTNLGEITSQITELGEGELDAVGEARRMGLHARNYSLRTQIAALEQEIAGQSKRQDLVTARRNLANLKLERLAAEVQYLQEKTGQRRLNEAAQIKADAQDLKAAYEEAQAHPIALAMAQDNIQLAQQIVDLASGADEISKRTANTLSRLDIVNGDLRVAQDFIEAGNLDRRAGTTLRRLSNQLQSPQAIKIQINESQQSRTSVTQQRLIAQENLRGTALGRFDVVAALSAARQQDPELAELGDEDISAMQGLHRSHRDLLTRIINAASARINETVELQNQQGELLRKTKELKDLLDEKLLWVPSVPAINLAWPAKVLRGAYEIISPEHLTLTARVFLRQIQNLWFVVLIFIGLIGACLSARRGIWVDIVSRSKLIGRVQDDNYWHTPAVIIGCILIALPIPLFFLMLSILFEVSPSLDPLIARLAETFRYLSLFTLLFLTWRAWDRDRSLFGAHYKLPKTLRKSVNRHLRWFIPVAGVSTSIIGLTGDSPNPDVYEGFSLFAFILTALALLLFAYKVLWARRKALNANFRADSAFSKYRGVVALVAIGLPFIAAIMAAFGYYDTANELLGRLFLSGWLFLLTYVIYGLIKRTILVAQRRLALTQATEKRDAAIRAREEKLAAEERGEEVSHPPLDTSEIDIKAMSRQSAQLLNTLIVLGFAALMWMIWSSLLPALSVFNEVEIGHYMGQIADETGATISAEIPVTLWNLMQSIVILGLTFIAAKNLPGFLEIFVLNRAGVDTGTRYAVTTILGYVIIAVGVIIGFDKLGLQWSQLKWIATGLSVGIGFGLQKIIANFISGLIILFERPVRIGDYVTIGDQSGIVSRIQIRATTLTDLDNREILIPNEALISERVTNWTLSNSVTRMIVPVGIAYGSDTDKARDIILDALKANPKILETPAPQVLFTGFGDSSLDFELRVFLKNFDERWPVTHTIHTDVNKALEKAGFTIPFPQRDLNIVSQGVPLQFVSNVSPKKKKTSPKKS